MVVRRPLVLASGLLSELPPGDTTVGGAVGTLTAGSGLSGGGDLSSNQRVDLSLAPNPSGLLFVGAALGLDGAAIASGNAALAGVTTLNSRTLTAGSGLLGGGDLSADRRFDLDYATQVEAVSGVDNLKVMTPLRVAEAIAAGGSSYNYTQTGTNRTLSTNERCTVISGFLTLSLPAPPSEGNEVSVIVASGSSNTVISGVGYPIMGLTQDLTIDSVDKTVTLVYIDSVFGWRIF